MESMRRKLMEQAPYMYGVEKATSVSSASTRNVPRPVDLVSRRGRTHSISAKAWTLEKLLTQSPMLQPVKRVSALAERDMLQAIAEHETTGEPLIIEDWHKHPQWPSEMFSMDWLVTTKGHEEWIVRDVRDRTDKKMTLKEFVSLARDQTSSDAEHVYYGKDAQCPEEWKQWVNSTGILPKSLRPNGTNDLLKNLDTSEAVESLMCYLGTGDTFTPCHKDLCASSGHNIMCYTEDDGSSFWFMTASADAPKAGEYFQSHIGLELDWEDHVATIEEFAGATFTIYVAEQRLGDLVLVPPRSCHQVVNKGGLTMKTSWSRMTIAGLRAALHHELPIYRRVCREEQYRVKYIVYRSLVQATTALKAAYKAASESDEPGQKSTNELAKRVLDLVELMDYILYDEFTPLHRSLPTILKDNSQIALQNEIPSLVLKSPSRRETRLSKRNKANPRLHKDLPDQSCNFACDFCGADIFQGFFGCNSCAPDHDDGFMSDDSESTVGQKYDSLGSGLVLCPGCYAEGRTCLCGMMRPIQCRPFTTLLDSRNDAARCLSQISTLFPAKRAKCTTQLSEQDIISSDEIKMFAAGCILLQRREKAGSKVDSTRSCRKCGGRESTHAVQYMHALHCESCHASACYDWMLSIGIHSADAILVHEANQQEWHAKHKDAQKEFGLGEQTVRDAERSGAITIYRDRLVMVARTYTSCRPHCPAFVRLGWYDKRHAAAEGRRKEHVEPAETLDSNLPVTDVTSEESKQQTRGETLTNVGALTMNESSYIRVSMRTSPSALFGREDSSPSVSATSTTRSNSVQTHTPSDASVLTPIESTGGGPASSTSKAPKRQMQMYVLLPPPPTKHPRSSVTMSEIASRKRKKHPYPGSDIESEEERRLQGDYSANLANVINAGNKASSRSVKRKRLVHKDPPRSLLDTESEDDIPLHKMRKGKSPRRHPSPGPSLPRSAAVAPAPTARSPPGSPKRSLASAGFSAEDDNLHDHRPSSPDLLGLFSEPDIPDPPQIHTDRHDSQTAASSFGSRLNDPTPAMARASTNNGAASVHGSLAANGTLDVESEPTARPGTSTATTTVSATMSSTSTPGNPSSTTDLAITAVLPPKLGTPSNDRLASVKKAKARSGPPGLSAQAFSQMRGRRPPSTRPPTSKNGTPSSIAPAARARPPQRAPAPLATNTNVSPTLPSPTKEELAFIQSTVTSLADKVTQLEKLLEARSTEIVNLRRQYDNLCNENQGLKNQLNGIRDYAVHESQKALNERLPQLRAEMAHYAERMSRVRSRDTYDAPRGARAFNGSTRPGRPQSSSGPPPSSQRPPMQNRQSTFSQSQASWQTPGSSVTSFWDNLGSNDQTSPAQYLNNSPFNGSTTLPWAKQPSDTGTNSWGNNDGLHGEYSSNPYLRQGGSSHSDAATHHNDYGGLSRRPEHDRQARGDHDGRKQEFSSYSSHHRKDSERTIVESPEGCRRNEQRVESSTPTNRTMTEGAWGWSLDRSNSGWASCSAEDHAMKMKQEDSREGPCAASESSPSKPDASPDDSSPTRW